MAGMPGDTPDRQWAQRQAAEAQNHIFDRCVFFFFFYSVPCEFFSKKKKYHHGVETLALANVMDYASFQERTVS